MRIPTGNFGGVVAAPQRAANIPAGAFGGEQGAALVRTGQQLGGIATERLRALDQARTLRTMAESKNGLLTLADELNQGIEAGTLDPVGAEAAWQERSRKFMDERLAGLNPEMRETVKANLLDTTTRLGIGVRDAANRRTQQNIGGELEALGNNLEREPDPARASQLYGEAARTLGPQAGWNPAQVERSVNTFREKAYATQAYSLVNGARNSMAGLNEVEKRLTSDEFSALDPQRRAVLLNTAAGYKTSLEQRAVAAAQRAEIQAAKREREAGVIYGQVRDLATQGKLIAPEFAQQAAARMAGTAYEPLLSGLLAQVPERTAFAMQPLNAQKAALDAFDAEGNAKGWTPDLQERRDALGNSYEASVRDYKEEPLRAAVERGVLPGLEPLNMAGGIPGIVQSVGARMEQAQSVQGVVGRPVSPLTSEEAGQLATVLRALPDDQKATTMASLSSAIGPGAVGALAAQLDSKDRTLALTAAYGDLRQANGGLVASAILGGQRAIDDKRVVPADVTMWRQQVAKEVRGVYASTEMEDAVIDAAVLARANAEITREGRSIKRAVEIASGGIIDFNGGSIPLPQGMPKTEFEKALVGLTAESFADQAPNGKVVAAGREVPVADFVRDLPNAMLRHAGQGLYTVRSGTGSVLNQMGEPVLVRIGTGSTQPAESGRRSGLAPGQTARGNIDLNSRPVVRNSDGTISTVRSMSFEEDGREVLVPTVSDDGRILDDEAAIAQYRRTGRHLGKFSSSDAATRYADELHNQQAARYGTR